LSSGKGGSSMLTGKGGNSSGTAGGLPRPEPAGGWAVPARPGVAARIADDRELSAVLDVGDRTPMTGPPLVAIRDPPAYYAWLVHVCAPALVVRCISRVDAAAVPLSG